MKEKSINRTIAGSLAVGRDALVGGNVSVQGRAEIGGTLRVRGLLDAPNVKQPDMGLFASEEDLLAYYPRPLPGWFAFVIVDPDSGTGFPAEVYVARVEDRKVVWVDTNTVGSPDTIDFGPYGDRLLYDLNAAGSAANTAADTANTAANAANDAASAANAAATGANTAASSANSAADAANSAASTATSSASTADSAAANANAAATTAANAASAANEAAASANSAATSANEAAEAAKKAAEEAGSVAAQIDTISDEEIDALLEDFEFLTGAVTDVDADADGDDLLTLTATRDGSRVTLGGSVDLEEAGSEDIDGLFD